MMQDFAMILLDIANNSIRANARLIAIEIEDLVKEDRISLKIQDDGCGMSAETIQKVTDPFYTSRTTRRIGMGLAFFKGLADQCDGQFEISSKENYGTTVKVSVRRSHWDTPPLGNLAESLITLIQAEEHIDFCFQYKTENQTFQLDTRQIKELLEEDSLLDPMILVWLKEYIMEQMNQVQGEGGTYEIIGRSEKNA